MTTLNKVDVIAFLLQLPDNTRFSLDLTVESNSSLAIEYMRKPIMQIELKFETTYTRKLINTLVKK